MATDARDLSAPERINVKPENVDVGSYKFGWHDPIHSVFTPKKGLSHEVVEEISQMKDEPEWMRAYRHKALDYFYRRPMPTWGGELGTIDFDNIYYFLRATEKQAETWEELPDDIKNTYDRLGIPEAEKQRLIGGVAAQYESEVVYHKVREDLEAQGVVFLDTDAALREHEDIFREHWSTVIPANDNKFSALNSAVWSGGSFVWVPEGVHVEIPLQAYFRINSQNMGQFERTLIIAEPGSSVHYVEGCTAPVYSSDSLHSAVVEIIVKPGAKVRYTTIQNWSNNVYNLVTKRAAAYENATMEWIDGNIGCLTGDTLVYIHGRGPVAIKDVQAGDEIYAADLEAMQVAGRRVNAVVDNGVREVFKLTTANHREIRATSNHPFLALTREPHERTWRLRWRALEDLRQGDLIAISDGLPDEGVPRRIDFRPNLTGVKQIPRIPEETDEDLMWLLGFYLGDGYIERENGRPRRVNFAVPETDPARVRVEQLITDKLGLAWRPNHNGVVVRVGSMVLGDLILHLGFGGTANEKRIPAWLYGLPAAQRFAFIEGYLAADGHIRNASTGANGEQLGQMTFASCNRELLQDLRMLMISVGLNPLKVSTYEKDRVLLGQYQKVYTSHYLTLNLRELPAIRDRKPPTAGIEFARVRSIEPDGEEPVYDIEVDGAHNFVANGLVVHNSKLTMKYPAVLLLGEHAHGEVLSVAFAGNGQHQDAGAKLTFAAPNTTGQIVSKSISRDRGRTSYRGLIKVEESAPGAKANVRCDALMLDDDSRSDTYPYMDIKQEDVTLGHEATVSKIGDDQLFYLRSRGLSEAEATATIVRGFVEPVAKELPMEYALELNRLISLQMEGAIG
jgi:Fe-S cluster assembly scaffold protein SufB